MSNLISVTKNYTEINIEGSLYSTALKHIGKVDAGYVARTRSLPINHDVITEADYYERGVSEDVDPVSNSTHVFPEKRKSSSAWHFSSYDPNRGSKGSKDGKGSKNGKGSKGGKGNKSSSSTWSFSSFDVNYGSHNGHQDSQRTSSSTWRLGEYR